MQGRTIYDTYAIIIVHQAKDMRHLSFVVSHAIRVGHSVVRQIQDLKLGHIKQ